MGGLNGVQGRRCVLLWERRFCFDASFGCRLESSINGLVQA